MLFPAKDNQQLPVPATRQLLIRQRLNLHPLELDIMTRDAGSLHDACSTLVVLASEQVGANRLEGVSVDKASEDKTRTLCLFFQGLNVQDLAFLLLEDENGHAAVWGTLLGVCW